MNQVSATILKEDTGYSATLELGKDFIATEGESMTELKENLNEALELALGQDSLNDIQINYHYDIASFFAFYRILNAKSLAERIGMHQSLLAQYISGTKIPSQKQIARIIEGVHQIGRELSESDIILKS